MGKISLFVALAALFAVLGAGMVTTNFTAYLGDNPATCNNCHVMDAAYEGWFHAPHAKWASCNDCHTPHAFLPKYFTKALNGYHHVSAFTLGNIPDAIRAKPAAQAIIQENCIRCHSAAVDGLAIASHDAGRQCYDCHRAVAHGERGISILPYQDKGHVVP